jgi:iron-sulfur cluster repair protein YtfE (RIC family)
VNQTTSDADREAIEEGVPPLVALEHEHREVDQAIEYFISHGVAGAARLRAALAALRRHIYLEEESLFPMLQDPAIRMPLFVMASEHRELWRTMDALEAALADGLSLEDLGALGRTLLAQLDRHNSKEEPIIYAQAQAVLTEDESASLAELIETAQLPAGWAPVAGGVTAFNG